MKGDFSRSTFNRKNGFTGVFMQQGRVLLDADFNEQSAIVLHYLRTLASDIIGPHDANLYDIRFHHGGTGFIPAEVGGTNGRIGLTPGNYYVDGILVENTSADPLDPQPILQQNRSGAYLLYLDVWERLITALEDPRIREVALGADDTCVRSQVVWRVRALPFGDALEVTSIADALNWLLRQNSTALMSADLESTEIDPDPCIQAPDSRYRGSENQLYRVEIHGGGTAETATFKWSRENGSVVFPVIGFENSVVQLGHLGRDWRSSLQIGDWVEVLDDDNVLGGEAGLMLRVKQVYHDSYSVLLEQADGSAPNLGSINRTNRALLRRWDHTEAHPDDDLRYSSERGVIKVAPGEVHTLEDGIQITFATDDNERGVARRYNVGDYWLITARTNGTIDWPETDDTRDSLPAFGIHHHYAPLAIATFANNAITLETTYTVDDRTFNLHHAFA